MPADWREAARGIPVWEGALCVFDCGASFGGKYRAEVDAEPQYIPDLSDPDTRAAYDRRLALALGAPEGAVNEGVRFYRNGSEWTIDAGFFRGYGQDADWSRDLRLPTGDFLRARALAWPADKRA